MLEEDQERRHTVCGQHEAVVGTLRKLEKNTEVLPQVVIELRYMRESHDRLAASFYADGENTVLARLRSVEKNILEMITRRDKWAERAWRVIAPLLVAGIISLSGTLAAVRIMQSVISPQVQLVAAPATAPVSTRGTTP